MYIRRLMIAGIYFMFNFSPVCAMYEKSGYCFHTAPLPCYRGCAVFQERCLNTIDEKNRNALHDLARHRTLTKPHIDNARKLLFDLFVDPNLQDFQKNTPAHYAAINGHRELLFLLLNHGGAAEAPDGNSKTIADLATDPLSKDVLQLCTVSDDDARKNPDTLVNILGTFQAVTNFQEKLPDMFEYFHKHVSVYLRVHYFRFTALHCAILLKLVNEVPRLLGRGANADAQDYLGFSALTRSLEQESCEEVVAALLRSGASLTTQLKSRGTITRIMTRVKDQQLRLMINNAIIKQQTKKNASDFVCPLCELPAKAPFEFVGQCGHMLCIPCKKYFGKICPWCPVEKHVH